uniref:Uncharacterized protein n=1 Tax=Arundo donax TaxID=35708 RepID=A0A0A8YAK0_ARUDO
MPLLRDGGQGAPQDGGDAHRGAAVVGRLHADHSVAEGGISSYYYLIITNSKSIDMHGNNLVDCMHASRRYYYWIFWCSITP